MSKHPIGGIRRTSEEGHPEFKSGASSLDATCLGPDPRLTIRSRKQNRSSSPLIPMTLLLWQVNQIIRHCKRSMKTERASGSGIHVISCTKDIK